MYNYDKVESYGYGGDITVLYADILFLINFCMDTVSLSLMLRLSSKKCTFSRLCIAAAVGSLYSFFDTVISPPRIVTFILSAAVSSVMVVICVGRRCGFRFYVKYTAVLWGVAALLAGVMTLICTQGGASTPAVSKGKSTLFVISAGIFFTVFAVRSFSALPRCDNAEVIFKVGAYERKVTAFIDTGNMAQCPISGAPVVFLRYDEKYDGRFRALLDGVDGVYSLPSEVKAVLRVVPVTRAGGSTVLCGVLCRILTHDKESDAVLVFEKVGDYGGCEALVPPSVI